MSTYQYLNPLLFSFSDDSLETRGSVVIRLSIDLESPTISEAKGQKFNSFEARYPFSFFEEFGFEGDRRSGKGPFTLGLVFGYSPKVPCFAERDTRDSLGDLAFYLSCLVR